MTWTISEIMHECDLMERVNDDNMSHQVQLARLQYDQRRGRSADLTRISQLQNQLRIRPMKNVGRVVLSEPFGVYYTRITVPWAEYHKESTCQTWDDNPIEKADIWMIPPGALLQTDRLKRAKMVRLHLVRGDPHVLLTGLPLDCIELCLNNVKAQGLVDLFRAIKPSMPNLKSLRYNCKS